MAKESYKRHAEGEHNTFLNPSMIMKTTQRYDFADAKEIISHLSEGKINILRLFHDTNFSQQEKAEIVTLLKTAKIYQLFIPSTVNFDKLFLNEILNALKENEFIRDLTLCIEGDDQYNLLASLLSENKSLTSICVRLFFKYLENGDIHRMPIDHNNASELLQNNYNIVKFASWSHKINIFDEGTLELTELQRNKELIKLLDNIFFEYKLTGIINVEKHLEKSGEEIQDLLKENPAILLQVKPINIYPPELKKYSEHEIFDFEYALKSSFNPEINRFEETHNITKTRQNVEDLVDTDPTEDQPAAGAGGPSAPETPPEIDSYSRTEDNLSLLGQERISTNRSTVNNKSLKRSSSSIDSSEDNEDNSPEPSPKISRTFCSQDIKKEARTSTSKDYSHDLSNKATPELNNIVLNDLEDIPEIDLLPPSSKRGYRDHSNTEDSEISIMGHSDNVEDC